MAPDANHQPPFVESPDEDKVYFPGTEAPRRRLRDAEILAADNVSASGPEPQPQPPNAEIPVDASVEPTGAKVEPDQPPLPDQPPKSAINQTYMYAGIGVGLGVLVAVLIAASLWQGNRQGAPSDFPAVVSSADGLRGHLVTKWEERPEYRLTIEPNSPQQLAGFSLAVGHSPRPLSFDIQLKDPMGFVLCSKTVVLRYDPRQTPDSASAAPASPAVKNNPEQTLRDQEAQAIDLTQLQAVELEREVGKDIFQNDAGPNGQVESINSQGGLPCSRTAFDGAVAWSFSSNFPTLAEQAALLNPQTETPAASPSSVQTPVSRRVTKRKPPEVLSFYYIEGDDQIVAYDASTGAIQTAAGRTSIIDKTSAEANALKGRDFPIEIHYRCDQTGLCTLGGRGGFTLHVRLKR